MDPKSARSKSAWRGLLIGVIVLGAEVICLAAMDEGSGTASGPLLPPQKSNPYWVITDRNAFRLNAPPPLPDQEKGPPVDIPALNLSGFVKTGNQLKVLLAVTTKSKNPSVPDQRTYLALAEGEHQEALELVKAHPDQETVDITYAGIPMTLSMKSDGFRISGFPADATALRRAAGEAAPGGRPTRMGAPATMPETKEAGISRASPSTIVVGGTQLVNSGANGVTQSPQGSTADRARAGNMSDIGIANAAFNGNPQSIPGSTDDGASSSWTGWSGWSGTDGGPNFGRNQTLP